MIKFIKYKFPNRKINLWFWIKIYFHNFLWILSCQQYLHLFKLYHNRYKEVPSLKIPKLNNYINAKDVKIHLKIAFIGALFLKDHVINGNEKKTAMVTVTIDIIYYSLAKEYTLLMRNKQIKIISFLLLDNEKIIS